jgi:uncharacterized protein (DUF1778 family)
MQKMAASKTERIVARVAPDVKEKIAYAAALEGASVTTFIERTVVRAAEETIRQHEVIPLSERASHALVASFFDPREPSAALIRARERHAALIISSEE